MFLWPTVVPLLPKSRKDSANQTDINIVGQRLQIHTDLIKFLYNLNPQITPDVCALPLNNYSGTCHFQK